MTLRWRLEEKMIEIGRLCVKTAGRDAGLKCIIVDILDGKFVLIDGETRRRKCNVMHLEPLKEVVKIKKNADHDTVSKVLNALGINVRETKPKPKTERQKRKRKTSEQLSEQKEEKKKLKDMFKRKKKEEGKEKAEGKKGESLEDKASLIEEKESPKKEINKQPLEKSNKTSKDTKK